MSIALLFLGTVSIMGPNVTVIASASLYNSYDIVLCANFLNSKKINSTIVTQSGLASLHADESALNCLPEFKLRFGIDFSNHDSRFILRVPFFVSKQQFNTPIELATLRIRFSKHSQMLRALRRLEENSFESKKVAVTEIQYFTRPWMSKDGNEFIALEGRLTGKLTGKPWTHRIFSEAPK